MLEKKYYHLVKQWFLVLVKEKGHLITLFDFLLWDAFIIRR